MKLHTAYIGLGSNLGSKRQNIQRALQLLKEGGAEPAAVSSLIATEPEGFTSSHTFLNGAAKLLTSLSPQQLLRLTQDVERSLGRTQKSSCGIYHDRTIDIDILFYDNIVINEPALHIPHPRAAQRLFVLRPLAEIAPQLRHPVTGKTVTEMMQEAKALVTQEKDYYTKP